MKENNRIDEVVGLIYEAALDSRLWPRALQGIAEIGNGVLSVLFVVVPQTTRLLRCAANAPTDRDAGPAPRGNANPHPVNGVQHRADSTLADDAIAIAAESARRALGWHCPTVSDLGYVGAKVLTSDGESIAAIAIQRARHQGPFERADLALLDRLTPHVLRALRLHARIADLDAQRRADRALRDRLPFAVIALDDRHRILELNQAAERLLAAGDGLSARHDRLRATHPRDRALLDRLIADAIAGTPTSGAGRGGMLTLRRASLRRPLGVTVVPVPRAAPLLLEIGSPLPAALVVVKDPETAPTPPAETLQCLFGLTSAEARFAAAFAAGDTLEDYAEAAALSLNYVRWLLKQIQAKTDTCSQVELVRVLVGHASPLAPKRWLSPKSSRAPTTW